MDDQQTDDIQKIPSQSPDFQTELAKKLQELAPEAIADGKVDTQKLKELLDSDTADDSERFGLFWPGKKRAMRAAQEPTTATLKPAKDESKDWDTTENIFIEGDNLEVLKVLQKHYHNRIKMIYIDPPYNTGKDFVYPDNYQEGLASYLEFTRQVDEDGKRLSTNSDTEGRFHSNWLNMMYPRLKLARNLLTEDGVIFISIGDDEHSNLRKLGEEIFGEDNFIGDIAVKSTPGGKQASTNISSMGDYILVFGRSSSSRIPGTPLNDKEIAKYNLEDEHGRYQTGRLRQHGIAERREDVPTLYFPIYYNEETKDISTTKRSGYEIEVLPILPAGGDGRWIWSKEKIERDKNLVEIKQVKRDGGLVWDAYFKKYYDDSMRSKLPSIVLDNDVRTEVGSKGVRALFDGKKYFDFPKPVYTIHKLISSFADKDFVVLDFFSGSGTTGHAVMQLNAEDGGNRKHIQVQLPEPTDEKSEAHKAGFKSIADIAKERIRKAGEKIKSEFEEKITERETPLDTGFRVYKLADTNFSKWRTSSETDEKAVQQQLLEIRESSNDAATEEDLLTEVLLKQGISLTAKVQHQDISGLSVWNIGDTTVLAYLNEEVKPNLDQLRAMADLEPGKIIVLEDAFQGDDELKTNLAQICKTNKIELWTV